MSNEPDFVIWPPHEVFYIQSMLFSTISALKSAEIVSRMVEVKEDGERIPFDQGGVLDELQNIIVHAGMLSRYFWPSWKNKEHRRRAEILILCFGVEETSPLKDRKLRDQMEHFDEKLDLYLANGVVGNIVPSFVGNQEPSREVPTHFFRAYFIKDGIFEVLGQRYELQPVVEEIGRIHNILLKCDRNGRINKVE